MVRLYFFIAFVVDGLSKVNSLHQKIPISSNDLILPVLAIFATFFLVSQPFLGWMMLLAIPLKVNHRLRPYRPMNSFQDVHRDIINYFSNRPKKLQMLDVSTGTCNSLIRHGWLELNADYYGIDFSETMLRQGRQNCLVACAEVNLALGEATHLPFEDRFFDIVTNYGAFNSYSNPVVALQEMYRVLKPGGTLLVYDEQLRPKANFLESLYFRKVLSFHDTVNHFPLAAIPAQANYQVHQVYPYYYLSVIRRPLTQPFSYIGHPEILE